MIYLNEEIWTILNENCPIRMWKPGNTWMLERNNSVSCLLCTSNKSISSLSPLLLQSTTSRKLHFSASVNLFLRKKCFLIHFSLIKQDVGKLCPKPPDVPEEGKWWELFDWISIICNSKPELLKRTDDFTNIWCNSFQITANANQDISHLKLYFFCS